MDNMDKLNQENYSEESGRDNLTEVKASETALDIEVREPEATARDTDVEELDTTADVDSCLEPDVEKADIGMQEKPEDTQEESEAAAEGSEGADESVAEANVKVEAADEPEAEAKEPEAEAEDTEADESEITAEDTEEEKVYDVPDPIDVMDLNIDDEETDAKGKGKWSLSSILLLLVGVAMIGYAGFRIGSLYLNYNQSNQEYNDIAGDFVTVNSGTAVGTEGDDEDADGYVSNQDWSSKEARIWYEMISVDLAGLQKKYPDVAAWLYQEGDTVISYPVMYSGDNDTYIHTTYKGSYAYAGSIFMEGVNNPDFNDAHTIIYGHNMRNGSMFGTLKYLRKDGYIDDHGYFQVFLADEIRRYQVFAYEVVEENSWLYEIPSLESDEYASLLEKIQSKSEISTGVEVTSEDRIITLSTCYGSNTTKRFVVQAVWVDTYYYDTGMTQSEMDLLTEAAEDATEDASAEPQETEELEFLAQ